VRALRGWLYLEKAVEQPKSPSSLRVVMEGHGRGTVFLDGNEVPRVRCVRIACEAGELNRVIIETSAEVIDFEGEVDVTDIGMKARKYAAGGLVIPPQARQLGGPPFWPAWIRNLFKRGSR